MGSYGWVVFCRDQRILDRPIELRACLQAKVHMFLFPGEALRDDILMLVGANPADICALAVARRPNVYWLTKSGGVPYERRNAMRARRRRSTGS